MPETADISGVTLVYVAPRTGTSGVSDYADDLLAIARERMLRVVEVRHGGSGQDGVLDVLRGRRSIRRALSSATGPVVLHTEQSGGVLLPFWGLLGMKRATVRSSTVHDAPLGVWLPFRTRLASRSRLVVHALHYPIMPLLERFERRALRRVDLFALTASGAVETGRILGHDTVHRGFLPVPERPELPAPVDRPRAVGLFGYVYRGKGFDSLVHLRSRLDPGIAIRVAGRGTDALPPVDGVDLLGGVEGADEDAFFASIQIMIVPYGKRSSYGPETHVASSAIARALAYQTPVVALKYRGIDDEALIVDGDIDDLADAVSALLGDESALREQSTHARELRARLTTENAFERYAEAWHAAISGAAA
ncbi:glycosyltransferase [Subtercola boreus]|uniref:glycosyltransferase n=1 Tax=Subtercola boreus TaxID=120213 RepID=UPI001172B023|nr:glycosyltransferase [Subtercola boreus]TQL54779.1 glycosyltransferase involved in cell wall biosynthesis [Subtercola boreus]